MIGHDLVRSADGEVGTRVWFTCCAEYCILVLDGLAQDAIWQRNRRVVLFGQLGFLACCLTRARKPLRRSKVPRRWGQSGVVLVSFRRGLFASVGLLCRVLAGDVGCSQVLILCDVQARIPLGHFSVSRLGLLLGRLPSTSTLAVSSDS